MKTTLRQFLTEEKVLDHFYTGWMIAPLIDQRGHDFRPRPATVEQLLDETEHDSIQIGFWWDGTPLGEEGWSKIHNKWLKVSEYTQYTSWR